MSNEYMLIPYHLRETLSDILRQSDVHCIDIAEIVEAAPLHTAHDGEVVAWLHTVRDAKSREGDTDLALSFDDHSFPLDSIGWVSIKAQPLFTAPPRVVDEAMVLDTCNAYDNVSGHEVEDKAYYPAMHAALKAALEQSK